MSNWKRYIPEGTRDILFEECSNKYEFINNLRSLYISSGFSEVASPTLEFYDVFHGENISIEQEKMYKLFDSQGRILVLRPDMTTPIARIVGTKIKEAIYPIRICYFGNIFRINELWRGKISEITQSGVEIIGSENSKSDSEVIITAIKALISIGLTNFEIELGQAEFFKGLIEDIELSEEEVEKLRSLVENKNCAALSEFVEEKKLMLGENGMALKSLPLLFGDIDVLTKARQLTNNQRALKAIDNVSEIYEKLKRVGLSSYVSIDLGMVQQINYYTGITFKAYIGEVGSNILSGGRYDNLISQFGVTMPAIGFAINVDSVLEALQKQGNNKKFPHKFLVYYNDEFIDTAYKLTESIRQKGYIVELSLFEGKENNLEYSKQKNFYKRLCPLSQDIMQVIDVKNNESFDIDIDEFINTLEVIT